MTIIRLAVIDDHPLFRAGVLAIFRRSNEFRVVGDGSSADDAVNLATTVQPDIVLLDVSIPGGGLNALREINRACPSVKVVMLTVSERGDDILTAFKIGAVGYLLKGIHKSELINAIKTAHGGEIILDPSLAVRALGQLGAATQTPAVAADAMDQLTRREVEVLAFVSRGCSNKDIAENLGLTERTVKNYMTAIMTKLQVRNRVEAALAFRRHDD